MNLKRSRSNFCDKNRAVEFIFALLLLSLFRVSHSPSHMSKEMMARAEREGRDKEERKGERRRGREGERRGGRFYKGYFPILFVQIYPSHILKDAGKINEIMVTLTLRVPQKNFVCFKILAKQ